MSDVTASITSHGLPATIWSMPMLTRLGAVTELTESGSKGSSEAACQINTDLKVCAKP